MNVLKNRLRTLVTLITLLVCLTGLWGCTEKETNSQVSEVTVEDLDSPDILNKIVEEALDNEKAQLRGPEGARLLYAPNSRKPYTGWWKRMKESSRGGGLWMSTLRQIKDGKEEGLLSDWHENGQKGLVVHVSERGTWEGLLTSWYENGQKKWEVYYEDDLPNGPSTYWHENGQKRDEGHYKDNKKIGKWTTWDENGKVLEETYEGGTHYFDKQIGRVITFEDNAGESYDNSEDALEYILESLNQIKEKLLALEKTKELYNRCMELSQQIRVSEREISEMQKRYLPKWPPLVEAQELDRILKQQFSKELQQVFRLSGDEKKFWNSNSENLDDPESGDLINAEIQFVSTRSSVLAREIGAEQRIFDILTTKLKEGNFSKRTLEAW